MSNLNAEIFAALKEMQEGRSPVSLLTGFSDAELVELGGLPDSASDV